MTDNGTDGNLLDRLADDGHAWATEFCARFPAVPFDDAHGFFCNAIENAWDVRCSKLTRSAEAWAEFQERVNAHRALWDEIDAASVSESRGGPESPGPTKNPSAISPAR